MNKFLIILCLFSSFVTFAESAKPFKMNLAVAYTHKRVFRGALIWDAPIMGIGPSFVFYDTVSIGGGGFAIYKKFDKRHKISFGSSMFDDNGPNGPVFIIKKKQENFKNKRLGTYGAFFKYEYRFRQFFSAAISYEQDLKVHYGSYLNATLTTSIIPFITLGVVGSTGSTGANTYAYGGEGVSGVGHTEYFASLMLPILPYKGIFIFKVARSKIIQEANYNADFVRGNRKNSTGTMLAMWSF